MQNDPKATRKAKRQPKPDRAPMTHHRRAQILDLVRQYGAIRVGKMAERFHVSEVTIRHDLEQMEKAGQLVRDHGGAIAHSASRHITSLLAVEQRAHLHIEAKRAIAHAAAKLVHPGDTIIMDAGTTVVEMVPFLANISPLTVVTNALNVALSLGASTTAQVILLGGTFNREASSTLGPLVEQTLADLTVQKAFLGTQALDLSNGLTDTTMEIAQVKRAMISAAREIILLSDSSKWGRAGFIKVAPLAEIDTLISDAGLPTDARAAIGRLDVELVLV